MTGPTIDCAIIDDEQFTLDRLNDILNEFDALDIVGTHSNYHAALENLLLTQPKLIFPDIADDKHSPTSCLLSGIQNRTSTEVCSLLQLDW